MFSHNDRSDMIHRLQSHPAASENSVPMKHSTGKINGFVQLGWCLERKKKKNTRCGLLRPETSQKGSGLAIMVAVCCLRRNHTQVTLFH